MNLVGKVPVEQLSDERLTNIERNLVVRASEMRQQPSRSPRRLLGCAGVAAAVAVAGVVGWKLHRDPVVAPTQPDELAMKDGVLDLGDAEITGKDFEVKRTAARTDIVMRPGRIELHVDHKPERLFVVRAGNVEIEDVGTRFSVDFDGTHVDVRVTEGEVKVKHAGKEAAIVAGNAWTLEDGTIAIAALDAKQATLVAHAQVPDPVDVVGAAGGSGAGGGHRAGADIGRSGAAGAGGNGSSAAAGSGSSGGSGSGSGNGSGAGKRRAGGPDAKNSLEKWLDEPLVPPSNAKDTRQSINSYLEQVQNLPEGERKAELLQSIAVMHLRAKHYAQAVSVVGAILYKRQGAGTWSDWPAYNSALWLDVRAKCLLSRSRGPTFDDACRLAAQKFIAKFPDGAQAGSVQQLLSEI